MKIYVGIILSVVILVIAVYIYIACQKELPTIYGIMITGKDDERIAMATVSCRNFFEQDYAGPKLLIIINHHTPLPQDDIHDDQIFQIMVDKNKNSLGAMRNIALELIPINALWTTWDDDDYRSQDYLSKLYKCLVSKTGASAAAFINRYEFNLNTNAAWRMTLRSGFVTMLCRKIPGYYYLNKDSMEDVNLKNFYSNKYAGIAVYQNKPNELLYIRLIHRNNTSLYVDANKTVPTVTEDETRDYAESPITEQEKVRVTYLVQDLVNAASLKNVRANNNG